MRKYHDPSVCVIALNAARHLFIALVLIARTLPSSNPQAVLILRLQSGIIAGQVVMAYLQSGFPSQDIRGKYRIKHLFNFQSSLEGVEYVPLLISRFLGRFRRGVRKIFL
ncbi:MAG: hypothetical protein ACOYEH_08710 [Caldicoprobacterales bacterium]|jgi:hypothetical protein